jgi:hypothetical protein
VFFDYGLRQLRLAIDGVDHEQKPVNEDRLRTLRQRLHALDRGSGSLAKPVSDPRQADWLIQVHGEKLLLVPAAAALGQNGDSPVAFGPIPENRLAEWLELKLVRLARASNLVRLAASPQEESLRSARAVQVRVEMLRFADAADEKGTPIEWKREGLTVKVGDIIGFRITNAGRAAVDVSVLFVDSGFGISQFFPKPGDGGNRLKPGDRIDTDPGRVSDTTTGLEHIVVIAARATPQTSPLEFEFLQQPAAEQASRAGNEDATPRGPEWESPLARLLIDSRSGAGKSRGFARVSLDEHHLRLMSWRTLPRASGR